jgi:type IV pilus assembly protein PilW
MKNQQGFSIIELLVAVAISFVAVLAASEAYIASKQTNRIQAIQTRLTEDGHFGLSMLQRTISQAGYRVSPTAALDANRISVANNVLTVKFTADGTNHIECDGTVSGAAVDRSLVIQTSSSALQCATNGGTASSWVAPSASGSGTGTEVVDFRVLLGVDTGPATTADYGCGVDAAGTKPRDCVIDKYVAALTGTETAEQIMAVRVCFVLRSQATDASITRSGNVTNCSGTAIANSQNDHKMYRLFNTTISMRNK